MPHYIQYSGQGLITKKWQSVGPSVIEGLQNILQLDYAIFKAITKYHIVDTGVVREMTQVEKDALIAYEQQVSADAETARINALDDKVSKVNVGDFPIIKVDNAIDNISSLADAKVFLKKMCRYIIKYGRGL